MEWLNLPVNVTRTDEYADSEPVERATWFNLLAYCAALENSGRIAGCRDWKSRKWEQLAGVTRDEVLASCKLWTWEGDDLIVAYYPADAERRVQAKSSAGRLGGLRSGEARRKAAVEAPAAATSSTIEAAAESASSTPEAGFEAEPPSFNETEQKETEGNGTEGNGTEGKGREGKEPAVPAALTELQRFQQAVNMLSPAWRKMAHWSAQDEQALLSSLPNLRALEPNDWLVLRWYFRWVASSVNQASRDPERLTTRRSTFLDELASHLERAGKAWRSAGRPRVDESTPATPAPAAAPTLPDFPAPADAAAYFRTLIAKPTPP